MTEQDERMAKLEGLHSTLATEVTRQGADLRSAKQDAKRALEQSEEALKTTQSSHRILTEHVDHAVGSLGRRLDTHLEQQDKHLQKQDAAIEDLRGPISVLHQAEIERAAKAQAEADVARQQGEAAKQRRSKRNDALRNVGIVVAIIGGLSGFFGAWRAAALWALQALHLSAH